MKSEKKWNENNVQNKVNIMMIITMIVISVLMADINFSDETERAME